MGFKFSGFNRFSRNFVSMEFQISNILANEKSKEVCGYIRQSSYSHFLRYTQIKYLMKMYHI